MFWQNIIKFEPELKTMLNIKIHSKPVYEEKAKVKILNEVDNTAFSDGEIPKKSIHCIYIAAINIDFVIKIDKQTILRFI